MKKSINGFSRKLLAYKDGGRISTLNFGIRRPYEEWMEQGAALIGGRVNSVLCHAFALGSIRKVAQRDRFQAFLKDRSSPANVIELPDELSGIVPFDDDVDRVRTVRLDANTAGIGHAALKGDYRLTEIDRITHNGILILGAMADAENMTDLTVGGFSRTGQYKQIRLDLYAGEHQPDVIYDYRRFGPLPENVL